MLGIIGALIALTFIGLLFIPMSALSVWVVLGKPGPSTFEKTTAPGRKVVNDDQPDIDPGG